jgi:hypothetical protein
MHSLINPPSVMEVSGGGNHTYENENPVVATKTDEHISVFIYAYLKTKVDTFLAQTYMQHAHVQTNLGHAHVLS